MKIDLSGKVSLVTGAGGQLGRVIARTLGQCGCNVAVHYRTSVDPAQRVADEIRSAGAKAMLVQADVTNQRHVAEMKKTIEKELGEVNILVINAVSFIDWKSVLDQPADDYVDQFQTCVMQSVLLTQAFVPPMVKKKWGRVIAINTECAMQCQPNQSAYASAKRGLDGVMRVLAREVGPDNVTVNQVAPGWTVSDRDRINKTEHRPEYEAKVPLRRRGEDQEIANAVAFLASGLADFISGVYLPVCGGNVMPTI